MAIDARKVSAVESGVGAYILNLVRALLEEDDAPDILLVRNGRWRNTLAAAGRLEEAHVPYPAEFPLTPGLLAPFLRDRRFDVFHSPFDIAPRGFDEPIIVTIHDINWIVNTGYNSHNPFMRLAGGIFYRRNLAASMNIAYRIIAISKATRNAIVEHAPRHESKIRVVYHGVDRTRTFPLTKDSAERLLEPWIDPAHPFVLTVGQASPYKNHMGAVSGFLQAFRDRPDYRMVLVRRPAGRDRALDRLLRTPQARAQVITLQSVSPDVLNALYNRARIVLHPSYYEGFGLPLVEAMAAGAPVVTSSVSSMPEVVGPAGLLVSPTNVDAIAEALRSLDWNESLRGRMVAAGHEQLARFDWSNSARATLEVYREAAREAAGPIR